MMKHVQIAAKMLGLEIIAKASTVTPIKFLFGGQKWENASLFLSI
jgi:hypothetical protein